MDLILYEQRDRVAVVTLNRPDQRNAQSPALLTQGSVDVATVRAMAETRGMDSEAALGELCAALDANTRNAFSLPEKP